MILLNPKRITLIVGHYGSGKTEFSVNYALFLAKQGIKTALIDLDIANPYFRSRERQELLESQGVKVYGTAYSYEITAEIPAISANAKAPLEDSSYHVIVDAGGDDSGARILNQFRKYFTGEDCEMLCVINKNRPETNTVEGAQHHITSIEYETGLKIAGLINNTHMLRQTAALDILNGHKFCRDLAKQIGISLRFDVCAKDLILEVEKEAKKLAYDDMQLRPIFLYMRPTWLDAL